MSDTERLTGLVEELTKRVQGLEDHVALLASMSTYGPSVDSSSVEEAAKIWTEDGIYDVGSEPVGPMHGRRAIREMLLAHPHQDLVHKGCSHSMTMPLIKIDGDKAVGIGYHHLFYNDGDTFRLWRLTASRWDWVRTPDGWQVARRTHRLMDGSEESRKLLRDAVLEITGPGPARESD